MQRSIAHVSLVVAAVVAAAGGAVAGCQREPLERSSQNGGQGGGPLGAGGRGGASTGGVTGMNCGSIARPVETLPVEVLILLDASGSMNDDANNMTCASGCGASSKWALAISAINGIVADSDSTTFWGLKLFADSDGRCGVSNTVAVPVAAGNASAIAAAIAGRTSANGGVSTGSQTPTRAAENASAQYLIGLDDHNPKVILLVTDGAPNCLPGSSNANVEDAAGAIQAVAGARELGIGTMVIGVATIGQPNETTLNDMAVAGGYPRANASPAYYPVASAGELTNTLRSLLGRIPGCVFAVPPPPTSDGTYSRDFIRLEVDGIALPIDTGHNDGWDYTDDSRTSIQLYGPRCDDILAGKVRVVSIVFRCTGG